MPEDLWPVLGSSSGTLQRTAEEASARFRETAKLANGKLDSIRNGEPSSSEETLASLQWIACMLLNTGEEALKAKTALARANEQHANDQLERATQSVQNAQQTMETAVAERDAAAKELGSLGSRIRKDGLGARQRQAKDAARLQALAEQNAQLQANFRLSEAAWAEERRAEQAAAAQRERNFQQVIMRLQQEVDARGPDGRPEGRPSRDGAASMKQRADAAEERATASANEAVALRSRVAELQSQTDRGVALIEKLKARLQQAEKDREAQARRDRDLTNQVTSLKEQLRTSAVQAQEAAVLHEKQVNKLRRESGAKAKDRYDEDLRVVGEELDAAQALAKAADKRATNAAVSQLAMSHKLAAAEELAAAAEKARQVAETRAAQLEAAQQASTQQATTASSGAIALLKAALTESQRKLVILQKAFDAQATELGSLREGGGGGAAKGPLGAADGVAGGAPPNGVPAPEGSLGGNLVSSMIRHLAGTVQADPSLANDRAGGEAGGSSSGAGNGSVAGNGSNGTGAQTPATLSGNHVRFTGVTPNTMSAMGGSMQPVTAPSRMVDGDEVSRAAWSSRPLSCGA